MKNKLGLSLILVALIFAARMVPHPANFTPVAAVALFASVYLGRRWSFVIALSGMFLSDILIGFYDWRLMLAVYASFALVSLLAWALNLDGKVSNAAGGAVLASVIFFLITNAAVWQLTPAYSRGLDGLMQSYFMGLPFLKNMLAGDLFFTSILFLIPVAIARTVKQPQAVPVLL